MKRIYQVDMPLMLSNATCDFSLSSLKLKRDIQPPLKK